jgi:hypothetical protein
MTIIERAEKFEKLLEALATRKRERVATAALLNHIESEIERVSAIIAEYRDEMNAELDRLTVDNDGQ